MIKNSASIGGVILAGGNSQRLQTLLQQKNLTDKFLLPLGERSLLQWVIDRATPQVGQLILNSNRSAAQLADYPLPLVADSLQATGPLGGVHSALQWFSKHRPQTEWLATFPADSPFFPHDLVAVLARATEKHNRPLVFAQYQQQVSPLFALWHRNLLPTLHTAIATGRYQVRGVIAELGGMAVDFSDLADDPFLNINTPEDWQQAHARFGNTASK